MLSVSSHSYTAMPRFNSIDTLLGSASLFLTVTCAILATLAGTTSFFIPSLGPIPIICFLLISCKIANDLGTNTEREKWEGHQGHWSNNDIEANSSEHDSAFTVKHWEGKPTAFEHSETRLESRPAYPSKRYSALTAPQREENLTALKNEKEHLESEQAEDQWHYDELENLWDETRLATAMNNFKPRQETEVLVRAERLARLRLNEFACAVLNRKIQRMRRIELDIGILEPLVADAWEIVGTELQ